MSTYNETDHVEIGASQNWIFEFPGCTCKLTPDLAVLSVFQGEREEYGLTSLEHILKIKKKYRYSVRTKRIILIESGFFYEDWFKLWIDSCNGVPDYPTKRPVQWWLFTGIASVTNQSAKNNYENLRKILFGMLLGGDSLCTPLELSENLAAFNARHF